MARDLWEGLATRLLDSGGDARLVTLLHRLQKGACLALRGYADRLSPVDRAASERLTRLLAEVDDPPDPASATPPEADGAEDSRPLFKVRDALTQRMKGGRLGGGGQQGPYPKKKCTVSMTFILGSRRVATHHDSAKPRRQCRIVAGAPAFTRPLRVRVA